MALTYSPHAGLSFKESTKEADSVHSRLGPLCHRLLSPQAGKLHFIIQLLSHSGASPLHVTHSSNSLWSRAATCLPLRAEPRHKLGEAYGVGGIMREESRFCYFGSQLGAAFPGDSWKGKTSRNFQNLFPCFLVAHQNVLGGNTPSFLCKWKAWWVNPSGFTAESSPLSNIELLTQTNSPQKSFPQVYLVEHIMCQLILSSFMGCPKD